jgi:hypothetical protein
MGVWEAGVAEEGYGLGGAIASVDAEKQAQTWKRLRDGLSSASGPDNKRLGKDEYILRQMQAVAGGSRKSIESLQILALGLSPVLRNRSCTYSSQLIAGDNAKV